MLKQQRAIGRLDATDALSNSPKGHQHQDEHQDSLEHVGARHCAHAAAHDIQHDHNSEQDRSNFKRNRSSGQALQQVTSTQWLQG